MNFKQKITELNLPEHSYIVVGSGILGALGIRESNDIDLVVDKEVYNNIEKLNWDKGLWGDHPVLQRDVFDIGHDWYGETAQDLLKRAQIIDGIPYLSLDEVYEWKKMKGREKDLHDVVLIDQYRAAH
jgi:hypothetical protein